MATAIEYALMAGRAYQTTRDKINWLPDLFSFGWTEFFHVPDATAPTFSGTSGFEAVSFQKGDEIVISFAGTGSAVDWWANAGGVFGVTSDQLKQAADYYLTVKAANPGAVISFAGHSLGGGLASLLAVFFGESAVTFDQAPFRNSASVAVATTLKDYLLNEKSYSATDLQGLTNFISAAANGGIPNEGNVLDFSTQGEILTILGSSARIGTQSTQIHGTTDLTDLALAADLHSQALLTAFMLSNQNAEPQLSFGDVTFKLPDLLRMIFDTNLFAHPTAISNKLDDNFLERLVRHQIGVAGLTVDETPINADAMLDRFTRDLWKIAQDGGLTLTDTRLSKALMAFAMQMYYEDTANAIDKNKQLYTDVTGGIQFDIADVSTEFKTSLDLGQTLNLSDAKGFAAYFLPFLTNYYWNEGTSTYDSDRNIIISLLPYMRDWYVQAGTEGLIATDTLNRDAFMFGGSGNDALVGGTGADLLVGNTGADTLQGGLGNDYLLGGTGNDTYVYAKGDGFDTLLDRDGHGSIVYDGATLAGGDQYGDTHVHRDADKHLYVDVGRGLIIDGNLMIENYSSGMGLTMNGAVADQNPKTDHDIFGDPLIHTVTVIAADGVQDSHWVGVKSYNQQYDDKGTLVSYDLDYYIVDDDGHPIEGGGPKRADTLTDSKGNDHIMSGSDDDIINATKGGDDLIEAGAGRDGVSGGDGKDVILGGADGDILDGGADDDRIYADTQVSVEQAIADGNSQSGSGQQGDWLAGGSGDDTLVGSTGNDVLSGGGGKDLLIGGAGDDDIMGDVDWVTSSFDWTVTDQPDGVRLFDPVVGTMNPPDGAADVIYAGEGKDHAWGGIGNDVIFGEGGNDVITGNSDNDVLLGGDGNDTLFGDTAESGGVSVTPGNDYLDGGEGDDVLFGNEGDDILIGGKGSDTLSGGDGKDTYIYNEGDGIDYIDDIINNDKSNTNILRFGAGVNKDNIKLGLGSLMLDLGNGDVVHIEGFNSQDVFNSSSINSFEFADGSVLTSNELLARGFDLDGTDGNDTIAGTNTTDRISGMDGDDQLSGRAGNDILMGGTGNDTLLGDEGNDVLDGGTGNDHLQGGAGDDTLDGDDGADALLGGDGNDALSGRAGNDELQGGLGNDVLDGGSGDDMLFGQEGSDVLDGGVGNDVLLGNAGDDVYLFKLGGGQDVIWEEGDSAGDVLRFGAGIAAADITIFKTGSGLVLSHANGVDQVTIANWYVDASYRLARFEFADGTIWNGIETGNLGLLNLRGTAGGDAIYGSSLDESLYGLEGNDQLYGNDGNDSLAGGKGNDSLTGGGGADTYVFGLGDGADVIDGDYTDTLRFGADISSTDIAAERVGYDLMLRHQNGTDSVKIVNWYSNAYYQLQKVVFDLNGTTWYASQLSEMGTNFSNQHALNLGDGAKTIEDWGGVDTLTFGAGIGEADITIARVGQNLRLSHVNGVDSVTIKDWFNDLSKQVETIRFLTTGTVLTTAQLTTPFLTLTGTSANDVIQGGNAYGETLSGLSGNDTLYGAGEEDSLTGGQGNDLLYGGDGADTYYFNQGDGQDTIIDTSPWYQTNTLIFGPGLLGQLSVSGGYGQDVVYSFGTGTDSVRVKAGSNITPKFVANGTAAADTLNGSAYGDVLHGLGGNDVMNGNDGADVLYGDAGNDTIVGGAGSDWLYGGDGDDVLDGYALTGISDDQTYGSDSTDYYVGGKGNDTLYGNSRDDYYYFNLGDGNDVITEGSFFANGQWLYSSGDQLIFGSGITLESIQATKLNSDLVVKVSATDSITVKNWFSDSKSWVDSFGFADGRYLTGTDITRLVLTVHGTAGDDVLTGDATFGNVLYGEAGNDTLNGGGGADALHGGAGDDVLNGSSGNDEYFFERGGGRDVIYDWSGTDTVHFDATINAADLSLSRSGNNLVLSLAGTNDALTIQGYFNGGLYYYTYVGSNVVQYENRTFIEAFTFADGSQLPSSSAILDSFLNIHGTSADDELTGTSWADVIYGGEGNDVLRGVGSYDVLYGDAGNDYLVGGYGSLLNGGDGDDVLVGDVASYMQGGVGDDIYYAAGGSVFDTGGSDDKLVFYEGTRLTDLSFQKWGNDLGIYQAGGNSVTIYNQFLNDAYKVERLVFADGSTLGLRDIQFGTGSALTGTAEDSILIGYGTNDTLNGGDGNDWLDGGTGSDTMTGGTGNDLYFVDDRNDVVTELAGQGTDTVSSTITYTLGSNIENLVLSGTASINGTGNTLNNVLTGNSAVNTLTGGAGNDWLDGKGGSDKMLGGTGDDTYVVDVSGETITERSNEGIDTVLSSVTYTLSSNVENLTLTGTAAINGTGNTLNNVLTGNNAANTLSGGTGADTMIGGASDDTYVVDNTLDVVTENFNEGTDLVQSVVTYTLAANVENLTLSGTSAINGTGNTLNNVLFGNSAVNTLTGGAGNDTLNGGAGADSMVGGTGDDTYVVDNASDKIIENANEGNDMVQSSVTYTLSTNVENLILTGATAINGTDNALNNLLTGNSGANTLTAGTGNDILQGGDGNDILSDTAGYNLLNGGAGTDTLTGASGNELFIGGAGNDTITTGSGYDIIAFNRGGGVDTVAASTGADNTLSLGGGIRNQDMAFHKSGNDLILDTGAGESISFQNWYVSSSNRSVVTLQMIEEASSDFAPGGSDPLLDNKIERFDFAGLVGQFDQAMTSNPALTTWVLNNALAQFATGGSDTDALGGDLAYQYGRYSNLGNVGLGAAQSLLGNAQFGVATQALQDPAALGQGVRLS